ncbi:MAG TPA: response regulator transcription factor [Terracidiphilus sp.]|nr:response regulator transcription factor [Terracidiphilus sp.]
MKSILVIEDDPRIQKALMRLFSSEGYQVHVESEGQGGLAASRKAQPAAVVLDLMLPGISGRELCRMMKEAQPELPVIILSAVSEVADKVLLLELGADDYVTKPFSPRELLARVEAAIRRTSKTGSAKMMQFGEISIDAAKMEVRRDGNPVTLTAHEFKLLRYFVENAGRVLTRSELLNDVWGYDSYPNTRTVDNQVLKLRQKLERDPAQPRHFLTVHGAGYKFVREG